MLVTIAQSTSKIEESINYDEVTKKGCNILEFDLYSHENNFVKDVRVKIELTLNKSLIPSIKIPLSTCGTSVRVVWIEFRCEFFSHFYYQYGLINHDTKVYMSSSGLNMGIGGMHVKFEE